jgi:hypothetical protein
MAIMLKNVTEYIPPIPKFRNTSENKLLHKYGSILSEQVEEVDYEIYEAIPDKKSLNAQIIGGDEMYNWVTSELSSQANAVQQVNKVKKSSNIKKSQIIPAKPIKTIKPNNIDNAVITVEEVNRKIKITESQFKRLFINKKSS